MEWVSVKFSTQLTYQALIAKMQFTINVPLNISNRGACMKLIISYLVEWIGWSS